MKKKLTLSSVNSLEATGKRYRAWDSEIQGFHLRVTPAGKKVFILTYRHQRVLKEYTIGKYGNLTVDEARRIARKQTGLVADGHDIQAERKASEKAVLRRNIATLAAFYTEKYQPWAESNLKGHLETTRTLNTDFKHLHSRYLGDISQWDAQKWASNMQKAGLRNTTINRRMASLKGVLSRAKEWGVIESNPLAGMKSLKTDDSPNVRYLSSLEKSQLLKALNERQEEQRMRRKSHNRWLNTRHNNITAPLAETYTDYLMPIILLALNTGMRRGEIFDLRWTDVNLRRKLITIRGEISKSGSTRHIPMSNEAHACLSAWKPEHLKNQLVFPSPTTGFRLNNIYSSWKKLLEKTGINNFRFHDLRHHFASTLVMKGVDLNTVRELLGHSDIKTTLRYAHLAPEHTAAAISVLNER